jgi:hypothetical protein
VIGRLCLSLTLPLVLGASAGGEWKTFSPKEGGFSILMPGAPTEDKQDVKTPSGDVTVFFFISELKNEGSLVVSFSEFPGAAFNGGTDENRLDSARDGAVLSAKGKLKTEKKITQQGFPGRELIIEIEGKAGSVFHTRIYAVKQRLYQTMAVGSKAFVSGKECEMFLNSFKLMK